MLKILTNLFFISSAFTAPLTFKGSAIDQMKKYEKVHEDFFQKQCTSGTEFKYMKLLKDYRGEGIYIPMLSDQIDREAIKTHLPTIKEKLSYIKGLESQLEKLKKLPPIHQEVQTIRSLIDVALSLQRHEKSSKSIMEKLTLDFNQLADKVFYLQSFNYPVDHLKNRVKYESFIGKSSDESKKLKNQTYFYRKIVEDGTFDKNNESSDLYTRSTLDTLQLAFNESPDYLTEELRYNLEWFMDRALSSKERKIERQQERMKEWYTRTEELLGKYEDIVKLSSKEESEFIAQKNAASVELIDFVYKKQKETYLFWKQRPPIEQAMFVFETILYNEVGVIDGEDAIERKDVAKIVWNRLQMSEFNRLSSTQKLAELLGAKAYKNEILLNTLFKRGEFSFTYYYIPSVAKIFCPDMSKRGSRIRRTNLRIALDTLKNYKGGFPAVRYFSRVSMLGKVDMSKVWSSYVDIPERSGPIVANQKIPFKQFQKGNYRFLYDFKDPSGVTYAVIEIGGDQFAVKNFTTKPVFFKYRSPHLFRYFKKK